MSKYFSRKRAGVKSVSRKGLSKRAVALALASGVVLPATGWAARVEGYKFNDLNNNKVMDANEPGLANETISVRLSSGSVITTTTNETGYYRSMDTNESQNYTVWSRVPTDWVQTTPREGTGMLPYTVAIPADGSNIRVDIGVRDPNAVPPLPNSTPQVSVTLSTVNVQAGSEVTFEGSFVDPDAGDSHTIKWDFGDGSVADTLETRHTYSSSGNYTVTLSVTDKQDAVGTAQIEIAVTPKLNTLPSANAGNDLIARVDQQIQLNGGVVDPDPNDTHTFKWDFGDGSTADSQNASHTYTQAGKFTVTLTVKDSQGGEGTDQATVTVHPAIGNISFNGDPPANEVMPPKLEVPASDSQELLVNITIPGADVTEVDEAGTIYHLMNIPESGHLSDVGKPQLPMVSRMIAVPKGAIARVEVVDFDVKEIQGYNIYPAQQPLPDEDLIDAPPPVFTEDAGVYERNEFYPANIAILDDTGAIRGTPVNALRVFPVQFNPVTQTLKVYSNIKVKVSFDGGVDNFTDVRVLTPSHEQLFVPLLLNADTALSTGDADTAYEPGNSLLIITHPTFLDAANTLAKWKIKRGIYTTVKTTVEIGGTAAAIQTYIKNAYTKATASNPPPSYVLLIGDAEFIPTHYQTDHPYHGFMTGTDLYYATMDSNDYFPDIYLGRLSVDTLAQATKRVNDIISYEKAVVTDSSFYQKATVAAFFQDYYTPYDKADRRFAQTSEDIATFLSSPSYLGEYAVDRVYYTDPNVNPQYWGDWFGGGPAGDGNAPIPAYLKKPAFAWNGNATNISATINQGRFLVTHRDHGEKSDGWGDPQYTPANVSALTNGNKLPVVWSVNCETGWFDNETDSSAANTASTAIHFSEAWERNPNGGAVGIIAATRVSYSGANDRLAWGWMDAIWPTFEPSTPAANPIWEMGAVLNYGKLYMSTKYTDDVYRKTEFEEFHWFGDPTMEMWTGVPQPLTVSHNASVVAGATSIGVTANVAGALITVSKATTTGNGEILGKTSSTVANAATTVSLAKPLAVGEQVSVVVTKHNYRPYEGPVTVKEATPCAIPTVTSNANGGWTPRAPANGDIALIKAGHTVTTDFVNTTNLCIEKTGRLVSTAGKELTIMASGVVLNQGEIRGADGANGSCPTGTNDASKYIHATPAKNVVVYADIFTNEGNIYGGKGGDDSTWKCLNEGDPGAWTYTFLPPVPGLPAGESRTHKSDWGASAWTQQYHGEPGYGFPAVGEAGGKVEVNSYTFTNKGLIAGGVGGYGNSAENGNYSWNYVHGTSIGGLGGAVTVNPGNLSGSINTGTLEGGCGGDVDIPEAWTYGDTLWTDSGINPSRPGNGGNVTFNAANQGGVIQGCTGSITRWDPTTLKADSNTHFEGSDHVEIYGPGDWVMELGELSEGAVSANKTITIAVGKGGVVDLRGISSKVFKAAEKVEIFADHILLDEGVTFADLAEAPVVNVQSAKILYRVALSGDQQVVGEAGATIPVNVTILNNGPTEDTYNLTLTNSEGWPVSDLPNTITVGSLKSQMLSFNVALPQESGENVLAIVTTSQGDPEISEVLGIRVVSELAELQGPYTVYDTVVNEAGKPVTNADITIHINNEKTATVDPTGYWAISGLAEGSYDNITASGNYHSCTPSDIVLSGDQYQQRLPQPIVCEPVTTLKLTAKSSVSGILRKGQEVTYTYTIVNGGPETATGVVFNNQLPKGAELISITVSEGDACDLNAISCTLPDLAPGAIATVTITLKATQDGTLKNVVTLTSQEYPPITRTDSREVNPDFSVIIKDSPDPVVANGQLHYEVIVDLDASAPHPVAEKPKLTLQLPEGTALGEIRTSDGNCDVSKYPTVNCDLNDLNVGTSAKVDVGVTLVDSGLLVLTHEAKVVASQYPTDTHKERTKIYIGGPVEVDIILIVDTTRSMQEEINGVIGAIDNLIKTIDPSTAPTVALITFKDDVWVNAFTGDLKTLLKAVKNLKVEGGGTCPEASAEALELGIKHAKVGGTILIATDAPPYANADIDGLMEIAKSKNLKLQAIITDGCSKETDTQ